MKHSKAKNKKNTASIIGFRSGREILFNASPLIYNKQSKVHAGVSNSLVLRKPLNNHFNVEGAISYRVFQNLTTNNTSDKTPGNKNTLSQKAYNIALPVAVNYFFFPGKCRVRPYFGAGFQYNLNLNNASNAISLFPNDNKIEDNQQHGVKYISFTQGITFQVNTKIQVTQSFHFIPDNNNKVIGIDLGIGCQLP